MVYMVEGPFGAGGFRATKQSANRFKVQGSRFKGRCAAQFIKRREFLK